MDQCHIDRWFPIPMSFQSPFLHPSCTWILDEGLPTQSCGTCMVHNRLDLEYTHPSLPSKFCSQCTPCVVQSDLQRQSQLHHSSGSIRESSKHPQFPVRRRCLWQWDFIQSKKRKSILHPFMLIDFLLNRLYLPVYVNSMSASLFCPPIRISIVKSCPAFSGRLQKRVCLDDPEIRVISEHVRPSIWNVKSGKRHVI